MNWQDLPRAPDPGTFVCNLSELGIGSSKSIDLDGFSVLLLRNTTGVFAYFNACPHQYLPLDWRTKNVLSVQGDVLLCSNHHASFDAQTGKGLDGFAQGSALTAIPFSLQGDQIFIGEEVG